MNSIGIMLGRLSHPVDNQIQNFPMDTWQKEFLLAEKIGFEVIEWVFDLNPNPIMNKNQLSEIKEISKKHTISINSVCADYFMSKKLVDVSQYDLEKNIETLKQLIENCNYLGIKWLEIPLVDSSSLKNRNSQQKLVENLNPVLDYAEKNNVFLTFETDLEPLTFKNFLINFEHKNIKANYDVGNSTSLGYDVKNELEILSPWISNIHVKDRLIGGSTIPLGSGDVDFEQFFSALSTINYQGDLIIQGAREDLENTSITPESTCKKYLKFVEQYIHKYLKN